DGGGEDEDSGGHSFRRRQSDVSFVVIAAALIRGDLQILVPGFSPCRALGLHVSGGGDRGVFGGFGVDQGFGQHPAVEGCGGFEAQDLGDGGGEVGVGGGELAGQAWFEVRAGSNEGVAHFIAAEAAVRAGDAGGGIERSRQAAAGG